MQSTREATTFAHPKHISGVSPNANRPGVVNEGERRGGQTEYAPHGQTGSGNSGPHPIHPRTTGHFPRR